MLFNYKAIENNGEQRQGSIEASSIDIAITSLQKRGLVITSIDPEKEKFNWKMEIPLFHNVHNKDIVIVSRQIATLFEAHVSALRVFRLIASQEENPELRKSLDEIANNLQEGSSISRALSKHPRIFSDFYVNMVKTGEESGKLDETFVYMADYLQRSYEVTSKAKNALIYPAFVILTFVAVMVLMFTLIIPKIGSILTDSGQEIPIYTKMVLWVSDFFVTYGMFMIAAIIIGLFVLWKYVQTDAGRLAWDNFKIQIPYVGDLYRKLYLSRIADNVHTLIASGVTMDKALNVSAAVVGNEVYKEILEESLIGVKAGETLSSTLDRYDQIPNIMVQMIKVGEETGELGNILKTLSKFYQSEVVRAVDTLVDLIEPVMIVILGLGVGVLVASILVPIYNITNAF